MADLAERIAEATRLTRAGRLAEATRVLRGLVPGSAHDDGQDRGGAGPEGTAEPRAGSARGARDGAPGVGAREGGARDGGAARGEGGGRIFSRSFTLAPGDAGAGAGAAGRAGGVFGAEGGWPGAAGPGGARMGGGVASRPYRLHVPASYDGRPAPLVVMLHGCTQSAADFAAGTRMDAVAGARGCLVVWPEQVAAANLSRCWRWFEESEQGRGGEPALVAGITRAVMAEYSVDPARVFVAGLSAGGAAAAVLGAAYPELYAAIGVHSGLACGAARDAASAMAAMRSPRPGRAPGRGVPAIVFHGDADSTVHPGNGDAVIAQARGDGAAGGGGGWTCVSEQGRVPGGRAWERVRHAGPDGVCVLEQWRVRGAGHAWSGGSASGSYTDPAGPDASAEMVRFFLEHPRRA